MGTDMEANKITILHFNDVYNIEPREQEPVGGAARCVTAFKSRKHLNPLVLFSGDAFNPSLMSSITKGKQMVPVLNALDVKCAVYGNHDFDFGVDTLVKMASETNFPWLIGNVYDDITGELLADGQATSIIEWQGIKIGLLGLVEEEWIATLATVDPDEITFFDYIEEGKSLCKELRDQGVDYIIALTHMRWPNDIRLAENVDEIDLILGGHDHDYGVKQINGKYVIKSGTDFRNFSQVTLTFGDTGVSVEVEESLVDSSIEEDPEIKAIVEKYMETMGEKMETVLGHMDVEMDGRFASIRKMETNLGNFITDIMLEATDANFALLNAGTMRSDTVHPKGAFKLKDLMSILPMIDPVVVLEITGSQVVEALENAVSQYPKLEGRFPHVAGMTFAFDPEKSPGSRVDHQFIKIQGQYLKLNKKYRVCTKHYMAEGRDGYDVLKKGEVLVNDEDGPRLSTSVQNHFRTVQIMKGIKQNKSGHRQSLMAVTRRNKLVKQMSLREEQLRQMLTPLNSRASLKSVDGRRALLRRRASLRSMECVDNMPHALAPQVEGRITMLDQQKRRTLEESRMSSEVKSLVIHEEEEESPSPEDPSDPTDPAGPTNSILRKKPATSANYHDAEFY